MKQYFLLCLLCLFCLGLGAQRFRPFLPGHLHFFQSTTNYSIRVDSVGEVNGDSTFWLNEIARPRPSSCPNYYHYLPHQEGLYGDRFVEMADGRMAFVSRAGDSAFFETTVPTGTSWTFATTGALTATLSNRSQSTFMGVTDTVLTIDISDGQQFQLTEHHGFLSAVNLGHYLNGANQMASTLYELPAVPDFKRFYDWQPGDTYGTWFHMYATGYDEWASHQIQSRSLSPDSSILSLGVLEQKVQIWVGNGGTFVFAPQTMTMSFDSLTVGFLEAATYEVWADSNYYFWQQPWVQDFSGHLLLPFEHSLSQGILDSCGFYPLMPFPEQAMLSIKYTEGLGMVYKDTIIAMSTSGYHYGVHRMVCYEQVLNDSMMPCPAEFLLLSTDNTTPAEEKISAWLDAHQQTQGIRWEGLAPGKYCLELLDLGGRLLWQSTQVLDANGRMSLPREGSRGVYLIRMSDPVRGWSTALKVPMMLD